MTFVKGYIPWNKGKSIEYRRLKINKIIGNKLILTKGQVTIIDKEDIERVLLYKWMSSRKYAVARVNKKYLGLSHYILKVPSNIFIDHINGDSLDNRKSNLRIVTHQQNMQNSKIRKNNTSGHKGVTLHKSSGLWRAQIKLNNKWISLGYFKDKIEAAKAYNKGALKYHGEFARLNVIP